MTGAKTSGRGQRLNERINDLVTDRRRSPRDAAGARAGRALARRRHRGGGLAFQLARRGREDDRGRRRRGRARARPRGSGDGGSGRRVRIRRRPGVAVRGRAFDGVASAFGVMFAADPERAAHELARVSGSGGKLGLTLMPMDSRARSDLHGPRALRRRPAASGRLVGERRAPARERVRARSRLARVPGPRPADVRGRRPCGASPRCGPWCERLDDDRVASLRARHGVGREARVATRAPRTSWSSGGGVEHGDRRCARRPSGCCSSCCG